MVVTRSRAIVAARPAAAEPPARIDHQSSGDTTACVHSDEQPRRTSEGVRCAQSGKRQAHSDGEEDRQKKRARFDEEAAYATPLSVNDAYAGGDSSEVKGQRDTKILREASARLVWTRMDEVEALKSSLEELGRAIDLAEGIRRRIELSVDHDLASAIQVAAARMPGATRVQYTQSFSRFFHALIGHLIPN